MTLDLQLIRECLRFSTQVYDEFSIEDRGTSTQVLVGGSLDDEGALIVAFRGSREPRDFINDARFLFKSPWSGDIHGAARVHRGFSGCWFSVADRVITRARTARRIILTGHSLGAADAVLGAMDLKQLGLPVWKVVTFGCPRVGNAEFRDFYNANLHDETLRVAAQGDPVTVMPPWLLNGYRHVGRELYLPDAGGCRLEPALWTKALPAAQAILNDLRSVEEHRSLVFFGPHSLRNYSKLIGQLA